MTDDESAPAVKSIVLHESDHELISLAARLLMAQEPGQRRQDGAEQLVQHYRDDLADAHPGVDPGALEEMTLNFAGALCWRWSGALPTMKTTPRRRRVAASLCRPATGLSRH